MADISTFRRNVAAAKTGVLLSPGPEWGDMMLRVRPAGSDYNDALSRAKNELVRQARADNRLKPREGYEQLPLSERQALGNRLCLERLFIEPENCTMAGKPVDAAEYRELAMTEEFGDLMDAVWAAVEIATAQRRVQVKAGEGNSSPRSDTNSNGAALPA
jgi:hypothetical protein